MSNIFATLPYHPELAHKIIHELLLQLYLLDAIIVDDKIIFCVHLS